MGYCDSALNAGARAFPCFSISWFRPVHGGMTIGALAPFLDWAMCRGLMAVGIGRCSLG